MPTYENLPTPSDNFKGKLYQKMVDDLRLAGKAKRTVYGYVRRQPEAKPNSDSRRLRAS